MSTSSAIHQLISLDGTIDRIRFAATAVILAVLKYALDSIVASWAFGRSWSVANYWAGEQARLWIEAGHADQYYLGIMLLLAVPFLWIGVALTVQRLRSAGCPLWFAVLFVVPLANFMLFLLLCLLPPRDIAFFMRAESIPSDSAIEQGPHYWFPGTAVGTVLFTAGLGVALTAFDVYALRIYGVGLFVALPFCLGMIASVLYGLGGSRRRRSCVGVALASVTCVAAVLILLAMEGLICLLMAAPIWIACAALGGIVGHVLQQYTRHHRDTALVVVSLTLIVPVIMGAEYAASPTPPVFAVRSEVEIDALPDQVWRRVISFPEIAPPREWVFRLGVAYPIGATIAGRGVGAERRCNFSTGSFIEPIEIWDAPRLLRFTVAENPPPMRELSFYEHVHAPHLHGFLVSRAGQFRLESLANGHTRLEGTTWYQHNMWPAGYWRVWSDAIIHSVHLRVLEHIRVLCERKDVD